MFSRYTSLNVIIRILKSVHVNFQLITAQMEKQKKQPLDYTQKWKSARKLLEEIRTRSDQNSSESESEYSEVGCPGNIDISMCKTTEYEKSSIVARENEVSDPGDVPSCRAFDSAMEDNHQNDSCVLTWDLIDQYNYLSSDSENETAVTGPTLETELSEWIYQFQVNHNAVDSLLKVLQRYGHPKRPSTARTLLGSSTEVETIIKSGMDYVYFGLKVELLKHFHKYPLDYRNEIENLEISLNTDGLPLFTSSKKTIWPVLCGIRLKPFNFFPV